MDLPRCGYAVPRVSGCGMCEETTQAGRPCELQTAFYVHVRTVPQPLGPDGMYGMETEPAGRSICVCTQHLAGTVRRLHAIRYRMYGAKVAVTPFRGGREEVTPQ